MNKPDSIFIKCDCGCSVLEVNYDEFPGEIPVFNLALWVSHPGTRPMSKKERIRWCNHVMKTGQPWADHTIVSKVDAQRIAQFINKYLKTNGKNIRNRK